MDATRAVAVVDAFLSCCGYHTVGYQPVCLSCEGDVSVVALNAVAVGDFKRADAVHHVPILYIGTQVPKSVPI